MKYKLKKGLWSIVLLVGSLTTVCAQEPGAKLVLPFEGDFASNLDPAWTVHLQKGNAVKTEAGMLEFHTQPDSPAYIERNLGDDLIRVMGAISSSSPGGVVSLTVYWNAADFIQIGLNRRRSDRLEGREVLGTYPHDYDLGPWTIGKWHWVAVDVAEDCIRFLTSEDGKHFHCCYVTGRPPRFLGPPSLLILGGDSDGTVFPPPDPWIISNGEAGKYVCRFRAVTVTRLQGGEQRASRQERQAIIRQERDVFGEQVLATGKDPTFQSVCDYYPALKWPRETVGVKDGPVNIGVAADGSLQFTQNIIRDKKPSAYFEVNGYRFGSGTSLCSKHLWRGYLPIVLASDRHDHLDLEETTLGYTKDFSPDQPLIGYVRFRILNPNDSPKTVTLRLHLQTAAASLPSLEWQFLVPEHGSNSVAVRIPYAISQSPARKVSIEEFDTKLDETSRYWERLIAEGSRFEIPERRVEDAYRAWIAYNFLNVAKHGSVYNVCDGSGFYNEVYGFSDASFCNALDLYGYPQVSALYLQSLLTYLQPNGLLAVNSGDTDTGAALWAMSQHYLITGDAAWLRSVAPKMIEMCNWIINARHAALARASSEPRDARGMIRFKPYADLLHPAADFFSNGYLWKGMNAAAGVLADIGMTQQAARLKRESDTYYRDLMRCMNGGKFEDHGMEIVPVMPDTHELWKESDDSANGYYGIIAPCMLEIGVPPWRDPDARMIAKTLEQRGGLTVGVSQFHDMIDHAYTYGYWIDCLRWDEPRRAILGLYGSLAYGMSRGTYAAVECTRIRSGENYWTLPHTYSNTQQLRLLRHMLVREEGDSLWLGQAIPRPWLEPGKRVAVTSAPTRFGPVSYSITANADGSMRVHLVPPTRNAPKHIAIRLRNPQQRRISTVKADPPVKFKAAGETIWLTGVSQPVEMNVTFK